MKLHLSSLAAIAATLSLFAACNSPVIVAKGVGGSGGDASTGSTSDTTGTTGTTGTGGATTSSTGTVNGTVLYNQPITPDPLATFAAANTPTTAGLTNQGGFSAGKLEIIAAVLD